MYLTATSIKDYLDCPQKLEYRFEGRESDYNAYFVRGSIVHEIIEDPTILTAEQAMKRFISRFSTVVSETDPEFPFRTSFSSMMRQSEQMLDNYYNKINIEEPKIKEVELFFDITIGDIVFKGKIDQIRGNSIYDWKTSTKPLDERSKNADYQFTLYGMAYKELYGRYPDKIYYGHLYSGKLIDMPRTKRDYEYMYEVAEQVATSVESNYFPRSYGKYKCGLCPYKRHCFYENGKVKYKEDIEKLDTTSIF